MMLAAFVSIAPVLSTFQTPEADVQKTIESFIKATLAYDVEMLGALTAPEFVEVSPVGEMDERDRFLSFYRIPPEKRGSGPVSWAAEDYRIRFVGKDVAVAVFRQTLILKPNVPAATMSFRNTMVLRRVKAGWRLVSNHVTAIRTRPSG